MKRKCFLAKIKLGNSKEKSKAQRQAVDSICQVVFVYIFQKSKTGEELLDIIYRPTAKETAVAAKFKSKGDSQVKEYCQALTKEDCRRQNGSFIACEKNFKYVHYELDPTPDVPPMMMGAAPPKPLKPQQAEYCSEVELDESQ